MPCVNAAMIACNRPRLTRQGIESFFATTPPEMCDLTVVDDASDVQTELLLRELQRQYGFVLVRLSHSLGGGFVSNLAIYVAGGQTLTRGEFLYHTASDFYFREGWLKALLDNWPIAEGAGIGLLGAYSHPYHGTNSVLPGTSGCDIHLKCAVAGGSWFMRWATWDKIGPLNTHNRGLYIGSEDTEFCFKTRDAGMLMATLFPEMVIHTGRTNTAGQPTLGAEWMKDVPGVIIE